MELFVYQIQKMMKLKDDKLALQTGYVVSIRSYRIERTAQLPPPAAAAALLLASQVDWKKYSSKPPSSAKKAELTDTLPGDLVVPVLVVDPSITSMPRKSMSSSPIISTSPTVSSSSSSSSPLSFSIRGRPRGNSSFSAEFALGAAAAGDDRGLDDGWLSGDSGCSPNPLHPEDASGGWAAELGCGNFWRVLPERELRWVGTGWSCSAV
ncbi:hypothetical protein C4D60_Mb09t04730 [Musa balbisiana]|uniref:Uncharacterized protein n=1 Tax=Musa balbisiana TaxID=52838 RepID=A0A4S8IE04_MUSBA|nr:hypothetical protein C4D60_Mb09t04730 [Musa balbisiana]